MPAVNGLQPLPKKTRWPEGTPLPIALAESALWHAKGSIHHAATLLGTDAARLGYLISKTPDLQETRRKASDLMLDRAEQTLIAALDDPDQAVDTAKWMLTNGGRSRGWGREAPAGVGFSFDGLPAGQGAIAIKWQVSESPEKP